MRRAVAFAFLLVALSLSVGRAGANPTVAASFQLPDSTSWQTASEKSTYGNWVMHSSPVVANLGDGPVILVGNAGGTLFALRYRGGSLSKVWSAYIGSTINSSPAVGDLNGDGCPEVIVGVAGQHPPAGVHVFDCHGRKEFFWPAPAARIPNQIGVFSTPAIGDINGDHHPDVVYGSFNTLIYAKDGVTGHDLPGWPHHNYDTVWSSPSLADVNGDGKKEVIIGTDLGGGNAVLGCSKPTRGTMSILDGSAHFMPNFPKCLDTPIWSSPAVQDFNGDGHLDVVVGTNNFVENGKTLGSANVVRAWDTRTGRLLWQTPLASGSRIFTSPAVGDVGGDGSLDIAIGTLEPNRGHMYLLDAHTGRIKWTRDVGQDCGACEFMGSPLIADVTGDGKPDVVSTSQDAAFNVWDAAGTAIVHDMRLSHAFLFNNSPAVADLDGDGRNEIVLAGGKQGTPREGDVWVISTSGHGTGPWPFFRRTIDRLGAIGSGSHVASSGSRTGGTSSPSAAYVGSTTSGHHTTPGPSASTGGSSSVALSSGDPATADPSTATPGSNLAAPSDVHAKTGSHTVLAAMAALFVVGAAGVAFFGWRRRAA